MNAKQWLDTVERHLGRAARANEQRFIARMYDADATDDSARTVARLILQNDATPVKSVFSS